MRTSSTNNKDFSIKSPDLLLLSFAWYFQHREITTTWIHILRNIFIFKAFHRTQGIRDILTSLSYLCPSDAQEQIYCWIPITCTWQPFRLLRLLQNQCLITFCSMIYHTPIPDSSLQCLYLLTRMSKTDHYNLLPSNYIIYLHASAFHNSPAVISWIHDMPYRVYLLPYVDPMASCLFCPVFPHSRYWSIVLRHCSCLEKADDGDGRCG